MSRAVEVITCTVDRLEEIVGQAVARALDTHRQQAEDGAQALSASRAARLAGCRDGYLLQALATGALPGRKKGARWAVLAADVADWVRRGKPAEVK